MPGDIGRLSQLADFLVGHNTNLGGCIPNEIEYLTGLTGCNLGSTTLQCCTAYMPNICLATTDCVNPPRSSLPKTPSTIQSPASLSTPNGNSQNPAGGNSPVDTNQPFYQAPSVVRIFTPNDNSGSAFTFAISTLIACVGLVLLL